MNRQGLVLEMSVGRICIQCLSGSMGDIAEVAQECTLVGFTNIGIRFSTMTDATQKVVEMGIIVKRMRRFFQQLVLDVVDHVFFVEKHQRSLVPVEGYTKSSTFGSLGRPAEPFPDQEFLAEFKTGEKIN